MGKGGNDSQLSLKFGAAGRHVTSQRERDDAPTPSNDSSDRFFHLDIEGFDFNSRPFPLNRKITQRLQTQLQERFFINGGDNLKGEDVEKDFAAAWGGRHLGGKGFWDVVDDDAMIGWEVKYMQDLVQLTTVTANEVNKRIGQRAVRPVENVRQSKKTALKAAKALFEIMMDRQNDACEKYGDMESRLLIIDHQLDEENFVIANVWEEPYYFEADMYKRWDWSFASDKRLIGVDENDCTVWEWYHTGRGELKYRFLVPSDCEQVVIGKAPLGLTEKDRKRIARREMKKRGVDEQLNQAEKRLRRNRKLRKSRAEISSHFDAVNSSPVEDVDEPETVNG